MPIKISVIIPTYNVERYIEDTLQSVMKQSFDDFEVICIDDASTDGTVEIIKRMQKKDNRISLLCNEKNSGPSFSRNVGLNKAEGEYVFFVDGDDRIIENALQKVYGNASRGEYHIVFFDYESYYESEKIRLELKNRYDRTRGNYEGEWTGIGLFSAMTSNNDFPGTIWCQLYKRSFLLENGLYFHNEIIHEDIPYVAKASWIADKVYYMNEKIYEWHHRSDSITTKRVTNKHIEGRLKGYLDLLSFWATCNFQDYENEIIARYMNVLLSSIKVRADEINFEHVFEEEPVYQYLYKTMINQGNPVELNSLQREMINQSDSLVIYGIGKVAALLMYKLQYFDKPIKGFAVTRNDSEVQYFWGHKVYKIDELIQYKNECLVIVAVASKNHSEIRDKLDELGFMKRTFIEY